jgi:hypothetical protein
MKKDSQSGVRSLKAPSMRDCVFESVALGIKKRAGYPARFD